MPRNFPGGPVVKTAPSNAGGAGLILGQRTKIPHALQPKNQNVRQKQYGNKFNKDLKKKREMPRLLVPLGMVGGGVSCMQSH